MMSNILDTLTPLSSQNSHIYVIIWVLRLHKRKFRQIPPQTADYALKG